MPIQILMPALSPTMTEGNVASWLKNEGDSVQAGDILCEIETDKATMEVEATDEGTLARIVAPAGTEAVPVNAVIGLILEEGEDSSALEGADAAAPAAAPAAPPAEPAAEAAAEPAPAAPAAAAPSPGGNGAAPPAPARDPGARIFASPLARRMAKQAGLALEAIAGTGPNGRIVKVDVEAAIAAAAAAPAVAAPAPAAAAPVAAPAAVPVAPAAAYQDTPASTMRKVIAQRLQEAKREVPHFYLTVDCEVDALLETRAQLNERSDAYNLSINDFVIRAAALALRKVPAANASWVDNALRQYSSADVSVAVAIEDGLITPIVRNADAKGLAEISAEVKELAGRARAKPMGLAPEEYQGGTFSVSNLGMYGIKEFSAIINPPQSMIIAVGTAEQRPVVKDGALAVATMMSCTLSVDHRVVDGALGAQFLQAFKGLIEDPLTMLL
ncbi:MAG: pyruvate dehydrogenase complex dihydrolipoamide acetyltransferase [Rhodospirillales bacterium]|nr:pyruvate dehydrogenase complex dihydrolipoamide acetyltransferase [Rhodospirillales bacterium]